MGEVLTVHIVDDDAAVRDSLALLLSLRGYRTALFESAEAFLGAVRADWTGCILADIRMPGLSGLELQHALRDAGIGMPVVIVTGHGDVASARQAFQADAVDFLEKPFDEDGPVAAVEAALARERARIASVREAATRDERLSTLTPREHEVMELLARGLHNREVAEKLGISARTVEVHKARVMDKLSARNLADLIRLTLPRG